MKRKVFCSVLLLSLMLCACKGKEVEIEEAPDDTIMETEAEPVYETSPVQQEYIPHDSSKVFTDRVPEYRPTVNKDTSGGADGLSKQGGDGKTPIDYKDSDGSSDSKEGDLPVTYEEYKGKYAYKDVAYYTENVLPNLKIDSKHCYAELTASDNSAKLGLYLNIDDCIGVYDLLHNYATLYYKTNNGYIWDMNRGSMYRIYPSALNLDSTYVSDCFKVFSNMSDDYVCDGILGAEIQQDNPAITLLTVKTYKNTKTVGGEFTSYWALNTDTDEVEYLHIEYADNSKLYMYDLDSKYIPNENIGIPESTINFEGRSDTQELINIIHNIQSIYDKLYKK